MSRIGRIKALTKSHSLTAPLKLSSINKKIICNSIGNIINITNTNYLLTCFHCIKNTDKQIFRYCGSEYGCSIVSTSDEFELALLLVDSDIECTSFTFQDLYNDINIEKLQLYIKTIKGNKEIKLNCSFKELLVSKTNITSLNLPQLPFITVRLTKAYSDISELSGISGSLLMSENKIIGIVSAIRNSLVYIIPSYVIFRFLKEIESINMFYGLCTLVGKFNTCDFQENGLTIYGVYVDDAYNINYNYVSSPDLIKYDKLKKHDIIIKIDDKNLMKTGLIYDSIFNKHIDFRTYIALNYTNGNPIKVTLMRQNRSKDYKQKTITIKSRTLNSLKYIPISFNHNMFDCYGLIFTELSEDIINNYLDMGILIADSIGKYYLEKPYRSDIEHIIVLIDIHKNRLPENIVNDINKIGLPLKLIKNKNYIIPYVSELNNQKIKTLDELKAALNMENKEFVLKLIMKQSSNIKVVIKNQNIHEIKTDA